MWFMLWCRTFMVYIPNTATLLYSRLELKEKKKIEKLFIQFVKLSEVFCFVINVLFSW